MINIGS
jgi:putative acetyltransferase